MKNKIESSKGSGNVFKDLGLSNPEERLQKAKIAGLIYDIINSRRLSQKNAAEILGINQPKVSALKNGNLEGFSIERLFRFLQLLEQDIEVVVCPKKGKVSQFTITAEIVS